MERSRIRNKHPGPVTLNRALKITIQENHRKMGQDVDLETSHDCLGGGQDPLIAGEGALHQQLNTPVPCTNNSHRGLQRDVVYLG
jgi:hypothetical protein